MNKYVSDVDFFLFFFVPNPTAVNEGCKTARSVQKKKKNFKKLQSSLKGFASRPPPCTCTTRLHISHAFTPAQGQTRIVIHRLARVLHYSLTKKFKLINFFICYIVVTARARCSRTRYLFQGTLRTDGMPTTIVSYTHGSASFRFARVLNAIGERKKKKKKKLNTPRLRAVMTSPQKCINRFFDTGDLLSYRRVVARPTSREKTLRRVFVDKNKRDAKRQILAIFKPSEKMT